jgi:hypothetical protein
MFRQRREILPETAGRVNTPGPAAAEREERHTMGPSTVNRIARIVICLAGLGLAAGCSTTYERRDPTGEVFPSVRGTALDDKEWRLPEDLAGAPVLILVGYEQDSQFDIDRWLLGLREAEVKVRVYEVPTIPGLAPRIFSGYIDAGMRSGIPSEDWGGVITLYGDASEVARFTGNDNRLPARVLLLDATGKVVFFHDRGYSLGTLGKLEKAVAGLPDGKP